jgi:hypothetical protein
MSRVLIVFLFNNQRLITFFFLFELGPQISLAILVITFIRAARNVLAILQAPSMVAAATYKIPRLRALGAKGLLAFSALLPIFSDLLSLECPCLCAYSTSGDEYV